MNSALTQYLAMSNGHGWARKEDVREAIKEAIKHSSGTDREDIKDLKICVYRVHPETEVNGYGELEYPVTQCPERIGLFNHKFQILSEKGKKADNDKDKDKT